jgi:high-affinity iron transporter
MLDAVLLVLREVLEAALIISLLLALSHQFQLRFGWSLYAIAAGIAGSWLLAYYTYEISDAFEGTGQELLNTALYSAVVICVVTLSILILSATSKIHSIANTPSQKTSYYSQNQPLIYSLFIVIVSLSLAREGSEIWIYLSGFTQQPELITSALIGAAIGTGIGMSLGAITYYLFSFMSKRLFIPIFLIVISLLAGGLSMQIAKQLMQIGLLDSGTPLWDSSFLVNEHSWSGELLYALLGYDSRPAPIQGIFYALTLAPIIAAGIFYNLPARTKKGRDLHE